MAEHHPTLGAVHDAARELGTFTLRELLEHLGLPVKDATKVQAKRAIGEWVSRGVIEPGGIAKRGRGAPLIYHYR